MEGNKNRTPCPTRKRSGDKRSIDDILSELPDHHTGVLSPTENAEVMPLGQGHGQRVNRMLTPHSVTLPQSRTRHGARSWNPDSQLSPGHVGGTIYAHGD